MLCREAALYGPILLDSLPGSSLPTRAAAPSKVLVHDGALHNPDDPEVEHNNLRRMNILTGALGSYSNTAMLTSVLAMGQAIDPCTLRPIPLASSGPTLRTE